MKSLNVPLVKAGGYASLPEPGIYPAHISDLVVSKEADANIPAVNITFQLPNGETVYSRLLLSWLEFSPIDILIKATLGDVGNSINLEDLIGAEVEIEVYHAPGKGGSGMCAWARNFARI